jgi:hypothetical protein
MWNSTKEPSNSEVFKKMMEVYLTLYDLHRIMLNKISFRNPKVIYQFLFIQYKATKGFSIL